MRFTLRRLLHFGRDLRLLRDEVQGIRFALERIAHAAEVSTGTSHSTFRGSLARPGSGDGKDDSKLDERDPKLLADLDAIERDLATLLHRLPTMDELTAEAEQRGVF